MEDDTKHLTQVISSFVIIIKHLANSKLSLDLWLRKFIFLDQEFKCSSHISKLSSSANAKVKLAS